MKMSTKMLLFGGLLVVGLIVFSAGTAQAIGTIGDSFTLSYQNLAGASYNTNSITVYISIGAGPVVWLDKNQKRGRGGAPGTYDKFLYPIVYGDTVTYLLSVWNSAATTETATGLTITDTWSFVTAINNGDSYVYYLVNSGADSSTSKDSPCVSANGTVTSFQYTTAPLEVALTSPIWYDVPQGSATNLAASSFANSIRGLRWVISNCQGGGRFDIKFTVRIENRNP